MPAIEPDLWSFLPATKEEDRQGTTALHAAVRRNSPAILTKLKEQLDSNQNLQALNERDSNRKTALETAFIEGFQKPALVLLQFGADIPNIEGNTVLHIAVQRNWPDVVKALLEKNCDVNITNGEGETPLHLAIRNNSLIILRHLLERPIEIDMVPLLELAVEKKYIKVIENLLKKQETLAEVKLNGQTLLHISIQEQWLLIFNILLEMKGKNPKLVDIINEPNEEGKTPLELAFSCSSPMYLVNLLKAGANFLTVCSSGGKNIFHIAAEKNWLSVINQLTSNPDSKLDEILNCRDSEGCTPLNHAFIKRNKQVAKILLEKKAVIDETNEKDRSFLLIAVKEYWIEIIGKILYANFKVDTKYLQEDAPDAGEKTALQIAVENNALEIVKVLLTHNANIDVEDPDHRPIFIAARKATPIMVETLLNSTNGKEQLGKKDKDGKMLIHLAAENDWHVILQLCLKYGCIYDVTDDHGKTPLDYALEKRNQRCIDILIQKQQDKIDSIQCDGESLFHMVVRKNWWKMIEQLIEAKVDINAENSNGETPLHIALKMQQEIQIVNPESQSAASDEQTSSQKEEQGQEENQKANQQNQAADSQRRTAEILINKGANTDIKVDGLTPLEIAVKRRWVSVLKLLLEKGATFKDINFANKKWSEEAEYYSLNVLEILKKHGLDVNVVDSEGRTLLHEATKRNWVAIMRFVIDNGADVNNKGINQDNSPLQLALEHGNEKTVETLLKAKDLDIKKLKGSLLHMAAKKNWYNIIKLLTEEKDEQTELIINAKDVQNHTPVQVALVNRSLQAAEALIKAKADIKVTDEQGRSLLHLAVQENFPNLVKTLLDENSPDRIDVNILDNNKNTPFHCKHENTKYLPIIVGETLLKAGADVFLENNEKETVLHVMAQKNMPAMVQLILDHVDKLGEEKLQLLIQAKDSKEKTALEYGVENQSKQIVQMLLPNKATVNDPLQRGGTLLHFAIEENWPDIVAKLLELEADTNIKNKENRTPLHIAASQSSTDILRQLIDAGAKVNEIDSEGKTPLCLATENSMNENANLLVQYGAILDPEDPQFPLHFAVKKNWFDLIKSLLATDETLFKEDLQNQTPLHIAAELNHVEAIQLLLESEPVEKNPQVINTTNSEGNTALHIAVHKGHTEIVRKLIAFKAAIEVEDFEGKTPLMIALEQNHQEIANILLDPAEALKQTPAVEDQNATSVPKIIELD